MALLNRNLLPTSPDAGALGRYGDIPVSLYTGVPSISIPLYTLKGRNLSLPLVLQYQGTAVRLDEAAPWTGMGWTLDAGGVINRTCRGGADFDVPWVSNFPVNYTANCNYPDGTGYHEFTLRSILGNQLDTQPDVFTLSFMGHSAKLVFDPQGGAHTVPAVNWRIVPPVPGGGAGGWRITTEDGTLYEFGPTGEERTGSANGGLSAWYLTRVTTLAGEVMNFHYGTVGYALTFPVRADGTAALSSRSTYRPNNSTNGSNQQCGGPAVPQTTLRNPLQMGSVRYLKRIVCGDYRVYFDSSPARPDLYPYPGSDPANDVPPRRLDGIRVKYLPDSTRYREYRLSYAQQHQRLWLTGVQERGVDQATNQVLEKPSHQLEYIQPIGSFNPYRGSYAVDRWGYSNGRTDNTVPWPRYTKEHDIISPDEGADRSPDPTAVQFGLLRRITYPTGGTTTLEFEPHDYAVGGPNGRVLYTREQTGVSGRAANIAAPPWATNWGYRTKELYFTITEAQEVQLYFSVQLEGNGSSRRLNAQEWNVALARKSLSTAMYDQPKGSWMTKTPGCLPYNNSQGCVLPETFDDKKYLEPGEYRLTIQLTVDEYFPPVSVSASVDYEESTLSGVTFVEQGGGVRIKRVTNTNGMAGATPQVTEYRYGNSDGTRSTGRLHYAPYFNVLDYFPWGKWATSQIPQRILGMCLYVRQCGSNAVTIAGLSSAPVVAYDSVTVLRHGSDGRVLKSVSTFRNRTYGDDVHDEAIIGATAHYDPDEHDANGQLLAVSDYVVTPFPNQAQGLTGRLVRRQVNAYDSIHVASLQEYLVAGTTGSRMTSEDPQGPDVMLCEGIFTQAHTLQLTWRPQVRTTETRYDEQGRGFTTVTETEYGNPAGLGLAQRHLQPTRRLTLASGGGWTETRYKYPLDYAPGASWGTNTATAGDLQQAHLTALPLEEQQWVRDATGPARWLGGKATIYARGSGTLSTFAPRALHVAGLAAPATSLTEAQDGQGRYTALVPDARYELRAELRHDGAGALAEQRLVGEPGTSYLWGYGTTLPIAEVQGATQAQIAYTSFEPDNPTAPGQSGQWSFAAAGRVPGGRAGRWAYAPSAGVVQRHLNTGGTYELSLWAQGGAPAISVGSTPVAATTAVASAPGGWQQWRWRLPVGDGQTVSIAAGSATQLDELRLHPVGAQMSTASFDPLTGVSARTDASGRTLTYEYDLLGRLLRVRDEHGRILTQQQYHYARD